MKTRTQVRTVLVAAFVFRPHHVRTAPSCCVASTGQRPLFTAGVQDSRRGSVHYAEKCQ